MEKTPSFDLILSILFQHRQTTNIFTSTGYFGMTFVQPSGKHDSCCLPLIFSTDSNVKGIRKKKELCYINKSISIIKTEA